MGVVPVLVSFGDVRREVNSVVELDDALDGLVATNDPILVELAGGAAVMNLGIGFRDAAVAMFLDTDGQPWCARSGDGVTVDGNTELVFAKNGTRHQFFANAAIAPSEMREAAREFVRTPGKRPTRVTWVREGIDAFTMTDQDEHGS